MKRIALLCFLVSFIASSASASIYATATGNWADPCIWDKGVVPPDSGDEIKIGNADSLVVTVNSDVGTYTTTKIDTLRDCTLYVTDGGFIGGGREWHIGDQGASSSGSDVGYMEQDGGTVDISASGKMFVGYKLGGDGTYTISGGSLTASGDSGRLYIGCGSVAGSIGKFYVDGDGASISVDGLYVASASSSGDDDVGDASLQFDLNSGAVSVLETGSVAIDAGGGGYAKLYVNIDVDPAADIVLIQNTGTSDVSGRFDDIVVNGHAGKIHTIGSSVYILQYAYDADSDGEINDIALKLIPEPATLVMLAIGGLIATKRRKM